MKKERKKGKKIDRNKEKQTIPGNFFPFQLDINHERAMRKQKLDVRLSERESKSNRNPNPNSNTNAIIYLFGPLAFIIVLH